MNRRDFARSLAALGLAPALPGLPAAAVPAAQGYTPYMFGLGVHMARATGRCSPEMLMRGLALSPEAAQAMQRQLLRRGIISPPGASGMAAAVQPYMRQARIAGATGAGLGRRLRRAAAAALEDGGERAASDPVPGDEDRSD